LHSKCRNEAQEFPRCSLRLLLIRLVDGVEGYRYLQNSEENNSRSTVFECFEHFYLVWVEHKFFTSRLDANCSCTVFRIICMIFRGAVSETAACVSTFRVVSSHAISSLFKKERNESRFHLIFFYANCKILNIKLKMEYPAFFQDPVEMYLSIN